MKIFTLSMLLVVSAAILPKRLNTETGSFIEAPMDYTNIGVRFVNIDDIKNNEQLFKDNEVQRIGGKGYLIAGTDDPAKYTGGYKKVVPGLVEMKTFLDTLSTKNVDSEDEVP